MKHKHKCNKSEYNQRAEQKMSYQVYRETTLGQTLQDTLDEMIALGKMNNRIAARVLHEFDKVISLALEQKVKNRIIIKCNKLLTYRFCDNVWTLLLQDAEFREFQEHIKVSWVKIVACDGKSGLLPIDDLNNRTI